MIQLCVVGAAVNEYDGTEKFSNSNEDRLREQASVLYSEVVNIEKKIQDKKRNSKNVVDAFTADSMREEAIIDLENFLGANNAEAAAWVKDFKMLQDEKYDLVPYAKMDSPDFLQTISDTKYKTFWEKHWKTIAAGGNIGSWCCCRYSRWSHGCCHCGLQCCCWICCSYKRGKIKCFYWGKSFHTENRAYSCCSKSRL